MKPVYELIRDARSYDTTALRQSWNWLVPAQDTPIFLTTMGDWVFGVQDGSLWVLSVLEGTYQQVARNSAEYNTLKQSQEWLDQIFVGGWFVIAVENGLVPGHDECIGWKKHPILGGEFAVSNLAVFSMKVYQSLMGQLHEAVSRR